MHLPVTKKKEKVVNNKITDRNKYYRNKYCRNKYYVICNIYFLQQKLAFRESNRKWFLTKSIKPRKYKKKIISRR